MAQELTQPFSVRLSKELAAQLPDKGRGRLVRKALHAVLSGEYDLPAEALDELRELRHELRQVGNNLNQVARALNAASNGGAPPPAAEGVAHAQRECARMAAEIGAWLETWRRRKA